MPDGSNGPSKEDYDQTLGRYINAMYEMMRAKGKCGQILDGWERRGGRKQRIQIGYKIVNMDDEKRRDFVADNLYVFGINALLTEETTGQLSFAAAMEAPKPKRPGAGGHPLGSASSIGIAKFDGYESGKRGSLALADNPWMGVDGAEGERNSWDEGFGQGVEDRPLPKVAKAASQPDGEADATAGEAQESGGDSAPVQEAPAPRKRAGKSRALEMAEQARAMDDGGRRKRAPKLLPAPDEQQVPPSRDRLN